MSHQNKIFFSTDVHGAAALWKKWLKIPGLYNVDTLMLCGDLTGKTLIPIINQGNGNHVVFYAGQNITLQTYEEIADMESKLKGLETGADDYLIKPFDTRELRTRVKNLIEQREKLRERFREIFLHDEEMSGSNAQLNMLRGIIEVTKRHLDDPEFDVIRLAGEMAFSRSQLYRKVHGVAGTTPNELIRMIKMKEAARLFRKGELNVTQVMYQVGMRNTSHFARTFRKFYGSNPGEYVKKTVS